jgi:hypothetical protein
MVFVALASYFMAIGTYFCHEQSQVYSQFFAPIRHSGPSDALWSFYGSVQNTHRKKPLYMALRIYII